ncbi:surA N-terminal domain protein [Neorickettsia helminthoeca str. Oregon]|uniref:SurA N-terminal domain protein n=1 Tax=Neorickettsia helminthoeca str. Oregon TaxID=1286528 RepID=X5H4Y1_9RICK|nr:hypothetical protein [Neorickettsia helminthoeca]AHX11626.1 surA N-terminal domain protein [Neorickettsia helminthoeca str. Oregon]
MTKLRYLIIFCFLCFAPCHSLEVKAAALVGNVTISNQDVRDYQEILGMLGGKTATSYKAALQEMIDLELYNQYAQKVGIRFSQQKYDAAINRLKSLGVKETSLTELFRDCLKKQVLFAEVVEQVIKPRIQISQEDLLNMKRSLLRNKNTVKLTKIDADGSSRKDLGWMKLDELAPEIKKTISKLPVGKISDPIEGSRFLVADKENELILDLDYKGEISEKSKVVGFYKSMFFRKLSDLAPGERKKLFLSTGSIEIKKNNLILLIHLDMSDLHSRLVELIYPAKLEKEIKKFSADLHENIRVVKY